MTHKDTGKDSDIEWVYVFDEENNRLFVRDTGHDAEEIVDLAGPEPDWSVIECAADFSRCHHYAWHHRLLPKTSSLSTRTYLGLDPLDFRDAIGFIIRGKRYQATGSGWNSNLTSAPLYRMRNGDRQRFRRDAWIATVKAGNGRRLDLPVASIRDGNYTPLPGVAWIMPGTKDNPKETVIGGVKS